MFKRRRLDLARRPRVNSSKKKRSDLRYMQSIISAIHVVGQVCVTNGDRLLEVMHHHCLSHMLKKQKEKRNRHLSEPDDQTLYRILSNDIMYSTTHLRATVYYLFRRTAKKHRQAVIVISICGPGKRECTGIPMTTSFQHQHRQRLRKQAINVGDNLMRTMIAHPDSRSRDHAGPIRDSHEGGLGTRGGLGGNSLSRFLSRCFGRPRKCIL
jgi:hypothetical protein